MRARAALGVGVLLTAAAVAVTAVLLDRNATTTPAPAARASLPAAPESALKVPVPRPLGNQRHLSRWSSVRSAVTARRQPERDAPAVARLATRTPEGTSNLVLVLDRAKDAAGGLWLRVRLPVLPNGTTGWVPREALGGYGLVRTWLVVDVDRFTATLLRDGDEVFRADIGVGTPSWPTPRGEFYIRNRLSSFANAFYGPIAFGTSARSSVLTDWPAGGFVGIHGTNRPDLLPGRVSHGCIRLRNEDITRLGKLMPVGTPVTIR